MKHVDISSTMIDRWHETVVEQYRCASSNRRWYDKYWRHTLCH